MSQIFHLLRYLSPSYFFPLPPPIIFPPPAHPHLPTAICPPPSAHRYLPTAICPPIPHFPHPRGRGGVEPGRSTWYQPRRYFRSPPHDVITACKQRQNPRGEDDQRWPESRMQMLSRVIKKYVFLHIASLDENKASCSHAHSIPSLSKNLNRFCFVDLKPLCSLLKV